MTKGTYSLLRLGSHPEKSVSWLHVPVTAEVGAVQSGSLSAAADALNGSKTVVVVPTFSVVLHRFELPVRNRQKLQSAIPYALEEQLVMPIDDLHFAYWLEDQSKSRSIVQVATVTNSAMSDWQQLLKEAGIRSGEWVAEQQLFPAHDEQNGIVIWKEEGDSYVTDLSTNEWLQVEGDSNLKTVVELFSPDRKVAAIWQSADTEWSQWVEAEQVIPFDNLLSLFAKSGSLSNDNVINLLQGQFSPGERWKQLATQWKTAAILFVLSLSVAMGQNWVELISLNQQHDYYGKQIESMYLSAFPGAKVVNPRLQMQQKLQTLQLEKRPGQGMMQALDVIAAIVNQEILAKKGEQGELQTLSYQGSEINMQIVVPSLQRLDLLKERLESGSDFEVSIQNASSVEGLIEGRIRINIERTEKKVGK